VADEITKIKADVNRIDAELAEIRTKVDDDKAEAAAEIAELRKLIDQLSK
jgi:hypothetical protein